MPTLEERIAFLEGRVTEHARNVDSIRDGVTRLEERIDRLEERIDRLEERMDRRFGEVDARLVGVDEKMTRYFVWLVGAQITTLAAVVAAMIAR